MQMSYPTEGTLLFRNHFFSDLFVIAPEGYGKYPRSRWTFVPSIFSRRAPKNWTKYNAATCWFRCERILITIITTAELQWHLGTLLLEVGIGPCEWEFFNLL